MLTTRLPLRRTAYELQHTSLDTSRTRFLPLTNMLRRKRASGIIPRLFADRARFIFVSLVCWADGSHTAFSKKAKAQKLFASLTNCTEVPGFMMRSTNHELTPPAGADMVSTASAAKYER